MPSEIAKLASGAFVTGQRDVEFCAGVEGTREEADGTVRCECAHDAVVRVNMPRVQSVAGCLKFGRQGVSSFEPVAACRSQRLCVFQCGECW
jgi:hypothetical protein